METKEKQELGVICSWMEVGDLPALPKEEVWGGIVSGMFLLFF